MKRRKLPKWFHDGYGITGAGFILASSVTVTILITILVMTANRYTRWRCHNYERVTGLDVRYVEYDVCYVKGSDGTFVRYDSYYKHVE